MKRLLLFYFACISALGATAQLNINRAYHSISEKPHPFLVEITGELYFMTQDYGAPGLFGTQYLYKQDKAGNLKFRMQAPVGAGLIGFKSLDNKLVVAGHNSYCDVFFSQYNFLWKADANGNTVFSTSYTVDLHDDPKACIQLADSGYFTFTDSLLFRFTKTGQYISKTNLGLNSISSALLLPNDIILLSAKNGGANILTTFSTNLVGGLVSQTPVLMEKLSFYDGQNIMGLGSDGKLYKFTSNLDLIGSSAFTGGAQVEDFVCKDDTVYSSLTSPSVLSHYALTDTSFSIISLSSTSTTYLDQEAICLAGSGVALLSTGSATTSIGGMFREHYFASLAVMPKLSSHNFTEDIALVKLEVDSMYKGNALGYLRAKATIKNVGVRAVTHFKLNCLEMPSISCGNFFYQENFTGLALVPGDSIKVTTGVFVKNIFPSTQTEYCFYTTLPNGETDKTLGDNSLCLKLDLTSLSEYHSNGPVLQVFPNPFGSDITVGSNVMIESICLNNALGMLVDRVEVNATHGVYRNSELPPGIYFLKIETSKGSAVKKIIKE